MLALKRLVGVPPEVNLKNQLHTGDKNVSEGSTLALKSRVDVTTSPKEGY